MRARLLREADVAHRLRPVRVGAHGNAALGELHVALGVAAADETNHVAPMALEHGRLGLLFELRTHAPIQFQRAVEAEKAHVVVEHEPARERLLRRARRPASARVISKISASQPPPKPTSRMRSPGAARAAASAKANSACAAPRSPSLRRDFVGVVGRRDAGRARNVAPQAGERLMHGGVLDVAWRQPRVGERRFDCRRDDLGDRGLAHEALLERIGRRVLARGVDIDEVMRQGSPNQSDAPRRPRPPEPPRRRRPTPDAALAGLAAAAARRRRSASSLVPSSASSNAETAQRRDPETSWPRVLGAQRQRVDQ